jgi:Tol biopolymer transport system component
VKARIAWAWAGVLAAAAVPIASAGEPVPAASDGVLAGSERPAGPVASNGRGRVAYWQRDEGRWELYLAGPRGENARLVYRASASPGELPVGRVMEWSPDGAALVFCAVSGRGTHLFLVRQDGSGLRCLSPMSRSEADPCWSPDGQRIAFLQAGPGAREWSVWTMRPDGSDRQQMAAASETAVPVNQPAGPVLRWSPDGRQISWRAQPLWLSLAGR